MAWMTLAEAVVYAGRDQLQAALLAGDIPARARYADGTTMSIPAFWWKGPIDWNAGLIAYKGFNPGAPDHPHPPGLREHPLHWLPVELERGALLAACPSGTGPVRRVPHELPEWFRDYYAALKAAGKSSSRDDDVVACHKEHPDVPVRLIYSFRRVLADPEWQRKDLGRPRKK